MDRQARTTDTEQYEVQEILQYRTIVRRTSGVSSRPSSAFRLAWRGHYYEVWKSPPQPERVVDHVALGTDTQPASIPKCSYVLAVAVHAGPRGRVATVERPAVTIVNLPRTPVWRPKLSEREDPVPDGLRSGTMHARAVVPVTDRYTIWITGAFHRRIELLVDGEPVTKPRREVNGEVGSFYLRLGNRRLTAGSHSVELRYDDEGPLRPGTGGHAAIAPVQTQPNLLSFGPLALQREDVDPPITYVPRSRARALCGKRLDWLEPIVSR